MIGDEDFDDVDFDKPKKRKKLKWQEALMEKFLFVMVIAALIVFYIMIVF